MEPTGVLTFSAALALAVPALGGALAQGRATAAAVEGITRNPASASKVTTPLVMGLALIESLVMFGLLVSLSILNRA